ncbi:MAG: hypothetical protein AAGD96_09290, partial [Chloroflexota bacterium]
MTFWRIKRVLLVLAFPAVLLLTACAESADPTTPPNLAIPTLAEAVVLPTETFTPSPTLTPSPSFTPVPPTLTPLPTQINLPTPLATGEAIDPASIQATSTRP